MVGETLRLTILPVINLGDLIPQGIAPLCNLALLLPHEEICHSDAVSPLLPSAGIISTVGGGLRGRTQDPEAPCKAHKPDALSPEHCQETSNRSLVQSNPNPA